MTAEMPDFVERLRMAITEVGYPAEAINSIPEAGEGFRYSFAALPLTIDCGVNR